MLDFEITIDNVDIDDQSLTFDIKGERINGLHKSIVNSLRRTLLSAIPTVAFRTELNDSDIIVIFKNV